MRSNEDSFLEVINQMRLLAKHNQKNAIPFLLEGPQVSIEDLLRKINLSIALVDEQNRFCYVSNTFCQLLGYPREELLKQGAQFLFEHTHAQDQLLIKEIAQHCTEVLQQENQVFTGLRYSYDYRITTGKGEVKRVYQHTIANSLEHDEQFYSVITLLDVTAFKTSEYINYKISHLKGDSFETISTGTVKQKTAHRLTRMESVVLTLLCEGYPPMKIADRLFVSVHTIKKHQQNLLRKTGSKNMVALVALSLKDNWVDIRK